MMRSGGRFGSWSSSLTCLALIVACSTSSAPEAKHSGAAGSTDGGEGASESGGTTSAGRGASAGTSAGGNPAGTSAGGNSNGGVSGDSGQAGEATGGGSGAGGGNCTLGAPAAVTASPGDRQVDVRWAAPPNTCSNTITGYVVSQTPDDTSQMLAAAATSVTMTGLTNGTPYTFSVAATSASGTGPSASATATPTATTITTTFPLVVSSNGRYLQDQNGAPFRLHADTAWSIFTELDLAGVRLYLDDRRMRGVNALRVQVSSPTKFDPAQSAPAARGANGALPFLRNTSGGTWTGVFANHDANFSSPNDAYWDWVDTVFREAAMRGIVLIADYAYMGWDNGGEGWWQEIGNSANTQDVCLGFGRYLGDRWKNHPNLIIGMGTDMFPVSGSESSARMLKILEGLQAAGCTQLVTPQYKASSDALDYADYASRVTLNGVYPQLGATTTPPHGRARRAYARTPARPAIVLEADYEGQGDAEGKERREIAWWSFLSTNCGFVYGNSTLWKFLNGWQGLLDSPGMREHQVMGSFLSSLPWHELVPRDLGTIGALVTAGGGTAQTLGAVGSSDGTNGMDWVAAAATPNGSVLVAYRPDGHSGTFTIDMTKLRGTTQQRWFDPTTGAYQSAGSDLPNTGTHVFTAPAARGDGSKDWVLRLDAAP